MFADCLCGMVDCPNSNHPSHVNSPSKVFCKEYFSPQHNSLDPGTVPISNVYPPFVERPNFQFHDNGIADVRRRKPHPKYDPRKLRNHVGRNNDSQFRGASATRSETPAPVAHQPPVRGSIWSSGPRRVAHHGRRNRGSQRIFRWWQNCSPKYWRRDSNNNWWAWPRRDLIVFFAHSNLFRPICKLLDKSTA